MLSSRLEAKEHNEKLEDSEEDSVNPEESDFDNVSWDIC
jgi:hypothetical protein